MNTKQVAVVAGVVVTLLLALLFFSGVFTSTSISDNLDDTNEIPQTSEVVDVVQYHDDEEQVVTVTYHTNSAVVVGAGVDWETMTRSPNNPQQFIGGDFALTVTGDTAVITRLGQPHFSGREFYDADSWGVMILPTCQRFFDGCNTCGQDGGCTKMWCDVYQKPRCLDNETQNIPTANPDESVASNDVNPNLNETPPATGNQSGILTNRTWYWQQTVYEGPIPAGFLTEPAVAERFSLTFDSDGMLQIGTDCNSMGTTYTTTDNRLNISPQIRTTLMYCEGSQEQAFSQMILTATRYRIEDTTLYIYLDDSHVMVLR